MNKMFAIARRILFQFFYDKRTLLLLFVAPIIVLWLLSVLLGASGYVPRIATENLPDEYVTALQRQDVRIIEASDKEAASMLRANKLDAVLKLPEGSTTMEIWLEGSDRIANAAVLSAVADATEKYSEEARENMQAEIDRKKDKIDQNRNDIEKQLFFFFADSMGPDTEEFEIDFDIDDYMAIQDVTRNYVHGSDDWETFDFFGPIFIGLFIFVFTFITSGMSLVNERSAGTMMRFLATPVKSWQILGGYAIGFGILAAAQVCVIVTAALKLIGFPNEGNVVFVVIVAVSLAIASVTFGLLVSGLAANAFQVIQLMLVFVVPQILLCGIFDLSGAPRWMQILSQSLPLTYGADAMQEIMLRGSGFDSIKLDLAIIWAFTCGFFILASLGLRKKHART